MQQSWNPYLLRARRERIERELEEAKPKVIIEKYEGEIEMLRFVETGDCILMPPLPR